MLRFVVSLLLANTQVIFNRYCGVATHFVESGKLVEMEDEIVGGVDSIDAVLSKYNSTDISPQSSALAMNRGVIDKCFDNKSCVEDIIVALENLEGEEKEKFGDKTLKLLKKGSSISLKVTLEGMRRGGAIDNIGDVLAMEYLMSQGFMKIGETDFYEGIRALLVDKDNKPVWMHGSVEEGALSKVTEDMVGNFFTTEASGGKTWTA